MAASDRGDPSVIGNDGTPSILTPDGRLLAAAASLCSLTGYTAEELLLADWRVLVHPTDLSILRDGLSLAGFGGATSPPMRLRLAHKRHAYIEARLRLQRVPYRQRTHYLLAYVAAIESACSSTSE